MSATSNTRTMTTLELPLAGEAFASRLKRLFPILALVLIALLFHWWSGGTFLTPRNLSNLSRQVCINLTLAVGMTLVILTSGIDLSVGSVLALAGMMAALTQVDAGWAAWGPTGALLSFVVALVVGAAAGAVNGVAVARFAIPPFIVSLGMMVVCRGLTLIVSGAQAVAPIGPTLGSVSSDYLPIGASLGFFIAIAAVAVLLAARRVSAGAPLSEALKELAPWLVASLAGAWIFCGYRGVPYMVFLAMGCAAAGVVVLKYTRYGRFLFAIGGNREAAELSGVPVKRTLAITYVIMGTLSGLAGALDVARVNGAVPSAGELAELDAIAAVVIGGTSLMGGLGSVTGTLFGVLIMGVLNNGMSLVGISEHYQKVFKGLVIILAVYLDRRSQRK